MGLTGWPFLWLTIAVAAGSLGCTVWLWPRLARQRAAHIAWRLGLILLSQALLIAASAVYANDTFGFFGSWSVLLGTGPQQRIATPSSVIAPAANATSLTVTGSSFGT